METGNPRPNKLTENQTKQRVTELAAMSTADGDGSESLSDIDDAEVAGYINSKEAARFKRMIWEVMNQDYQQGKSRKRAKKVKKAAPAKKAVKASAAGDNKKSLSSKINYDALKKLNEELGDDAPGLEEGTESNSGSHGDMQLSNENNSFEHENTYSEDAEDGQGYNDDTYFPNEEYNGFNYDNGDEEYDFDEF